jgi:hypothetical protein
LNVASLEPAGVPGAYAGRFEHAPIARAVAAIAVVFHNVDMVRLLILDTWNAPDSVI